MSIFFAYLCIDANSLRSGKYERDPLLRTSMLGEGWWGIVFNALSCSVMFWVSLRLREFRTGALGGSGNTGSSSFKSTD